MPIQNAQIEQLCIAVPPVAPEQPLNTVADLFLTEEYRQLLSLPVVAQGRPVGLVSRYQIMKIFLTRYGRELYGRHPVAEIMNSRPLMLEQDTDITSASQFITANLQYPITEDFIILEAGQYRGLGVVLDLLRAMERRMAQDAAELETAYRRLKDSQTQLVQSEKMASLGQMVAGVAHEINTPLGYVRNNVEMTQLALEQASGLLDAADCMVGALLDPATDEAALGSNLDILGGRVRDLRESAIVGDTQALCRDTLFGLEQISELVLNLRNFSRLDQARVSDIDLNTCLDSVLVIANNVLKNRITVVRQYGSLPAVRCVPSQINQVLLNMVTNAAQAIEGNGQIILKTDADNEMVRISIRDSGRGMPSEVMERIFDPFFTTKPIGQGTGLGLSISYQIVQQHQGHIHVTSVVGEGSRFVISLPRQSAVSRSEAAPVFAESA